MDSSLIIFVFFSLITAGFIALSLVYSTLILGISPMPSSKKAYKVMMELVDETGTGPIIDLGSGWGSFVIRIAMQNPERQVIGYELSLLPWLISVLFKNIFGLRNLALHRKNFYMINLPPASVFVCYLYPEAMNKIQHKLSTEQPEVDFIISNNFALPLIKPDKVMQLNDFYKSPIYLYKIVRKDVELPRGASDKSDVEC